MRPWRVLAVVVAGIVAVLVVTQPLYPVALTVFDYGQAPEQSYSTMQTKDTTRFPAEDPALASQRTARAAVPPGSGLEYDSVVRVPEDDWQAAVAASRLRASEDAIVLFGDATLPRAGAGPNVTNATNATDATNATGAPGETAGADVEPLTVSGGNPAETAAAVATRGADAAGADDDSAGAGPTAGAAQAEPAQELPNPVGDPSPNNAIVVSSEAPRWALPAVSWSAYSGDPILYANESDVPAATERAIEELNASHVYVLAPEDLVSDGAASELDVPWTRVAGQDPQHHAVRVAQYRDESRDFGWGIHERDKVGYYNFALVNPSSWEHAVAAANLQWGKAGPVLLVEDDGELSTVTEQYAWQTQPAWFSTPAEGPFNHVFAMGSLEQVSWVSQGRLDYAVEITPYRLQGAGLSPLEALTAVWAAFGMLGAAFTFAHARHRIPEMTFWTKLSWPLFVLVLGPVGLALYWKANAGRPVVDTEMGKRVLRPYWLRAATATAMGIGFAGSTMIATGFVLTYTGIPMVVFDGPLFWLGNAMTLMIGIVYAVAFAISLLVFHVPMMQDNRGMDLGPAFRVGATAVAVSMTSVAVGMMGGMWVLMMLELPMMPGDDNLLWFGVMAAATLVGFLIAWPINGLLVRRNVKPGGTL